MEARSRSSGGREGEADKERERTWLVDLVSCTVTQDEQDGEQVVALDRLAQLVGALLLRHEARVGQDRGSCHLGHLLLPSSSLIKRKHERVRGDSHG